MANTYNRDRFRLLGAQAFWVPFLAVALTAPNGLAGGAERKATSPPPPRVVPLPDEYRHEPSLALEAEEDGLAIVKRILRQAGDYLAPNGVLIVEVGNSAQLLQDTYPDIPFIWLEFSRGGEGVFLLGAQDLAQYAGSV